MQITGDKAIDKALKRLAGPVAKKAIKQASKESIKPVMAQARSNARDHSQSGTLAKSYKARSMKRSRSRVGSRVTTEDKSFTGKFYASFQELGWKSGKQKTKNPGHQDLKTAADDKRSAVLRDYRARLKTKIDQLAKAK